MLAPALLIPVQDLFYVEIWHDEEGKSQATLQFNSDLFTFDLINLLCNEPDLVLYVLLSNYQGEDLDIVLRTTIGTLSTRHLELDLLPFLRNQLTYLGIAGASLSIQTSRDMQLLSGHFCPQEVKWAKENHSHRLYLTHFTSAPRDELIRQYQLQHIPFHSSLVELQAVARAVIHLMPVTPSRHALILLDIDHTLLDNQRSSIFLKTLINDAVVNAVQALCLSLDERGYAIDLFAMTARNPNCDARFTECDHPFAMQAVVTEVNKRLGREVKTDSMYSYSNRGREPANPKRRKLDFLEALMFMGLLQKTYHLVALVDDCPYECEPRLVAQNRADLQRDYQVNSLIVLQVQRLNYFAKDQVQLAKISAERPLRRWGFQSPAPTDSHQATDTDTTAARNAYA